MIREFSIHILSTIHFLQEMDPVDEQEVLRKQIELKRVKPNKKLLLFDLDETLAHCVR